MTVHSADARNGKSADDRAGKRERILDAAEEGVAGRGFLAAQGAGGAREAGVAVGTIYLYFKIKDDLLVSLFEARMEIVNRTLAGAVAGAPTPRAQLAAFVRAYLALVAAQPTAAEVLTIELRQST